MSIQNISIYSNGLRGQGNTVFKSSFLNIGQKGQIVQGTITKAAEGITINFNGIEVTVSGSAVKNAGEGEVRNFQITDVSKNSIVLKEVNGNQETGAVRSMQNTSVDTSNYSFAECLEASKDTAQAKADASQSLTILNGEDYEQIEKEEGSLMDSTKECVERAVEKRKERKEWIELKQQEGAELRKEQQEGLEKLQAAGFLSQKSEARIRQALQEAGVPVTDEILDKVMTALDMSRSALDITDQSKAYIVGQDLAPTIENLYQGKYSAAGSRNGSGGSQQGFAEYQDQIQKILEECGHMDEEGMENAKWLFANELPINVNTLDKLAMLNSLPQRMNPDKVAEQIIFAVAAGSSAGDAVLDDSEFVVARDVVHDFQNIEDSVIINVADALIAGRGEKLSGDAKESEKSGESQAQSGAAVTLAMLRGAKESQEASGSVKAAVIPKVYADGMSEADILKVTMKRQLEEIRQKMTIQSAVAMEQKGIHIETEPLENIIQALREMERAYYRAQVGDGSVVDSEELDMLQEALGKTADIADAHAALLGTGVRQQALLTVNELHAAVSSRNTSRHEWNSVFETVGTQVRTDLGDSIQKAFAGVPAILKSMGLEDTQANERAVRILGYNSMEITRENIEEVRIFDAKVNQVIDNMKPVTVLELIRRGQNPLDMPLDDLNRELEAIQEEKGISPEERYSRFLWQMEKSGQLTAEERSGYIGVYRLLNQIQKTDGAAIGALLGTGQELTLGNLLTQVRTRKGKGIDSVVDDASGAVESGTVRNSITEQIREGFAKDAISRGEAERQQENTGMESASAGAQQKAYYQHLVSEALSELTPSGLQEMTDADMEKLLNVSLEKFCEDLKQTAGNREIKKAYFEEQARELRDSLASGEAAEEYLSKLGLENTIGNIMAAGAALEEGYSPFKEAHRRRNVLSGERQKELEETVETMEDSIGDEEELNAQCEKAEKIMREILTKSYEQADITFEDFRKLRKLGQGIHLEGQLRQSKSYDIPIRTGDGITSLNLTIIHGAEESGKIQISMEDENFGNISVDLKVSGSRIKGLVLCDERQGFEALMEQSGTLEQNLTEAGFFVKNISYGMDFKSRNDLLNENISKQSADTSRLYQVSKILVKSITAVIRE